MAKGNSPARALFGGGGGVDGRRIGQRVAGAGLGRLAHLHVAHLDFDALDLEAHQRAVGEGEDYDAGRRIGLLNVTASRLRVASASLRLRPNAKP